MSPKEEEILRKQKEERRRLRKLQKKLITKEPHPTKAELEDSVLNSLIQMNVVIGKKIDEINKNELLHIELKALNILTEDRIEEKTKRIKNILTKLISALPHLKHAYMWQLDYNEEAATEIKEQTSEGTTSKSEANIPLQETNSITPWNDLVETTENEKIVEGKNNDTLIEKFRKFGKKIFGSKTSDKEEKENDDESVEAINDTDELDLSVSPVTEGENLIDERPSTSETDSRPSTSTEINQQESTESMLDSENSSNLVKEKIDIRAKFMSTMSNVNMSDKMSDLWVKTKKLSATGDLLLNSFLNLINPPEGSTEHLKGHRPFVTKNNIPFRLHCTDSKLTITRTGHWMLKDAPFNDRTIQTIGLEWYRSLKTDKHNEDAIAESLGPDFHTSQNTKEGVIKRKVSPPPKHNSFFSVTNHWVIPLKDHKIEELSVTDRNNMGLGLTSAFSRSTWYAYQYKAIAIDGYLSEIDRDYVMKVLREADLIN